MKRIVVLVVAFAAFALANAACGGDSNKPPMTPDSDKPAELVDAGPATTSTPPAK